MASVNVTNVIECCRALFHAFCPNLRLSISLQIVSLSDRIGIGVVGASMGSAMAVVSSIDPLTRLVALKTSRLLYGSIRRIHRQLVSSLVQSWTRIEPVFPSLVRRNYVLRSHPSCRACASHCHRPLFCSHHPSHVQVHWGYLKSNESCSSEIALDHAPLAVHPPFRICLLELAFHPLWQAHDRV